MSDIIIPGKMIHPHPNTVIVLDHQVNAEVSNTTDETTMFSYTVPAGTLRKNDALMLNMFGRVRNNTGTTSGRTIQMRWNLGGVELWEDISIDMQNYSTIQTPWTCWAMISALDSTSSQRLSGDFKISAGKGGTGLGKFDGDEIFADTPFAGPITASSADFTTDTVWEMTMELSLANAAFEVFMDSAVVQLLPKRI